MISWNIRGGLNLARKQRYLRFLNCKFKIAILGILETKKEVTDEFVVHRLWTDNDFDFTYVPSLGATAGLFLIWNKKLVINSSMLQGSRWVSLTF